MFDRKAGLVVAGFTNAGMYDLTRLLQRQNVA